MHHFTGQLPFNQSANSESNEILQSPYIALAPMEGLMDGNFREVLTAIGGIDHCVTEFIRVTDQVFPEKVFYRLCPELHQGGKTLAGTPVHVQLLGSQPEFMAKNAAKAARLGAPAIDLNFGCPAKTVNKNMGGAVLLQYPERLHAIASSVRQAVPYDIPVSAKMRLGYQDKELAIDNALALADAGVQWITIHARTKAESYRPPAYWQWIAKIKQALKTAGHSLPVLANGEIWTPADAERCQQESNSNLLMIGRGLVAVPDLGLQIQQSQHTAFVWQQRLQIVIALVERLPHLTNKQMADRIKQWLHYLTSQSAEIKQLFDRVKKQQEAATIIDHIRQQMALTNNPER